MTSKNIRDVEQIRTHKKVEETYFFQFYPDTIGRNWSKLENKANLRDLIAATGLVISNWIQIVNFSAREI